MAVKKVKMIERFKVIFPKSTLSKERLDLFMDKLSTRPEDDADDSAIDVIINDYNDLVDFTQIAKDDDKLRRAEADRLRVQKELEKLSGRPTADETDEDEDDEELAEAPAWAKKMLKDNKTLRTELETIKNGNVTDTKRAQAKSVFSKSELLSKMDEKVQSKWLDRVNLESETSFEDQVKGLEEEYSTLVQSNADSNSYAGGAGQGHADGSPEQKQVDKVVDKMRV